MEPELKTQKRDTLSRTLFNSLPFTKKKIKSDDATFKHKGTYRANSPTNRCPEADMSESSPTSEAFVTIPTHPSPGVRFTSHGTEASRLAPGGHWGVGGGIPHSSVSYNSENTLVNRFFEGVNDKLIISQAMERLSNHMIPGASHDSSSRYPPASCYPGTRSAIQTRILSFFDEERGAYLHWIYGRAGAGKSAIVQSLAESLALHHHLGASVFISQLGNRNNSQRLFITIAYQLAEYIGAYRTYIVDKLALNPDLVNKGMKEQFQTLIVRPFTEWGAGLRTGARGRRWAILLDGLDELDQQRAQQQVIRLISTFLSDHPEVPLIWIVASRPEPNISATFHQVRTITPRFSEEAIPEDSTDSYKDVERYLHGSFAAMRIDFPRFVPQHWPSPTQVEKLACAASGLFAFASAAIQFIADMEHANPVARLETVLNYLAESNDLPSQDRPFLSLDDLYTHILDSIPPDIWPTTKRVLGALLYHQSEHFNYRLRSFEATSIILGLEPSAVHTSVNRCFSALKIPPPEEFTTGPVTLYHGSFANYLTNPTRSGSYHISTKQVEEEVHQWLSGFWSDLKVRHALRLDSGYGRGKEKEDREQDDCNIDSLDIGVISENQPTACLDVPYTYILSLIPSEVWSTTKRVFSILLCSRTNLLLPELRSLKGISVILALELGTIYDSLDGCSLVLKVPPLERACAEPVTFRHTSFGGYLTDVTRSESFHIPPESADEEVLQSLLEIWRKFQAQYIPGLDSEYGSMWNKYCEQYHFDADSWDIKPSLFYSIHHALFTLLVEKNDSKGEGEPLVSEHDQAKCFDILSELDSATICQGFRWQGTKPAKLLDWVFDIWKVQVYREKLADRGIVREVRLGQIQFEHLDSPLLYPSHTYVIQDILNLQNDAYDMIGPRERHISGLRSLQQRCPQLPVLICGNARKRFLLFKDTSPPQGTHIDYDAVTFYTDFTRYYIIPYPDLQDSVDFLRVGFEAIRKSFPHIDMAGWPNEPDFRKLADATSGRQVFATVAIRFIEDSHHANPATRLGQVLSLVDGCDVVHSKDRSNLYLDALYTHILSSIPTAEWPNTKRILGAILYAQSDALENGTTTLAAVSAILDIDLGMVYHLLKACSSVLKLAARDGIDGNQVVFYHTSFVEYLQEPTRSQLFHVSIEDARADILQLILRVWQNFMEQPPSMRDCYTWTLRPGGQSKPSSHKYIPDAILALLTGSHGTRQAGSRFESQQDEDRCLVLLAQLDAATVCDGFGVAHMQRFFPWLVGIWKTYEEKLMSRGIIRQIQLAELQFHHVHSGSYQSYYTCERVGGRVSYKKTHSRRMLSALKFVQQYNPQIPVFICGIPEKRFALFEYEYTEVDVGRFDSEDVPQGPGDARIYIISYDSDQVPSTQLSLDGSFSCHSSYRNKLNTVCDRQKWGFQKGECVPSGPTNQIVWTGRVYVNENPFEGKGSSKRAAWEAAAKKALDHIKATNPEIVDDLDD